MFMKKSSGNNHRNLLDYMARFWEKGPRIYTRTQVAFSVRSGSTFIH